jgi:TolB protein
MIRMMLLLLAAAVMAVLLAGCDVITHPLQDKVQNPVSPVPEDAIVVQPVGLPESYSYPASYIYVIGQDGTNEARSIHAAENEAGAVLSPDGKKIAFLSGELDKELDTGVIDVYVMDIDGTDRTKITPRTAYPNELRTIRGQPAWSPDSERVAFTSDTVVDPPSTSSAEPESAEEVSGIYVANASGWGDPSRIRGFSSETTPWPAPIPINLTWSPDGEKIAFYDGAAIKVIKGDKNGQWDLINNSDSVPNLDYAKAPYSWSPGGERLAFVSKLDSDLYVTNTDGLGQRRLTETLQPEGYPAWSPDGKKIAFVAKSDSDVYVIDTDGTGRKRLANTIPYSSGSNAFLAWSPDGKKIAFFCPTPPGSKGRDLCTINADGSEWKRIALKVLPENAPLAVSWGSE